MISRAAWTHGDAEGICQYRATGKQPLSEVRNGENSAALATTLVHALLHGDVDSETERSKRELEAEAVAYIVGRCCGLDMSGSAFYLAAWESEDPKAIFDRLERISATVEAIIDIVDEVITDESARPHPQDRRCTRGARTQP